MNNPQFKTGIELAAEFIDPGVGSPAIKEGQGCPDFNAPAASETDLRNSDRIPGLKSISR